MNRLVPPAAVLALLLFAACAYTFGPRLQEAPGRDAPLLAAAHNGASTAQFTLDTRNIISITAAILVASTAASAGVGGGAFFVPLFMVVLGWSLKEATVLSQAAIAAVSLASIAYNLPKRHPSLAGQTLIDYDMCLTMTPALVLGVTIGVIFNVAFPTWLITTMLLVLLVFMCTRTTQKGLQQWRGETRALIQAKEAAVLAAAADAAARSEAAEGTVAGSAAGNAHVAAAGSAGPASQGAAPPGGKPQAASYPWGKVLAVLFLWLGFGALAVLRQQMAKCSTGFFVVLAAQVLFGACCSALFAYLCVVRPARSKAAAAASSSLTDPLLATGEGSSTIARQVELHTEQQQQQHQASMLNLMIDASIVSLAGMVAGIVGIGGGLLMAPMLLDAGVHPVSASATSNILVFMASSIAAFNFLLDGRVNLQYAAVYCTACAASSLVGLTLVGQMVKASGRPSLVVLLLAFIMGAGAACSGVFGYLDAWNQQQAGEGIGFKSIC